MNTFTEEQKKALLVLSEKYDSKVYEIVSRGRSTEISIFSKAEAVLLEQFSSRVCGLVIKDNPDITGRDIDINADAEMIVHLVSDVLYESDF